MLGAVTVGVGFTVMVKVWAVPVHPFNFGVTVIVAVIADEVELVAEKDAISPTPFAAKPILVLLFAQK